MRIIALLLVFALGFFACLATIVGSVVYVYHNVTYDRLEDWKIIPPGALDDYVERDADAPYTSMTLAEAYREISALRQGAEDITVEFLLDYHGVKLSDEAYRWIPNSVRTLRVSDLFRPEGLDHLLDYTTLNYIFNFLPEGVLSTPAREALEDKTLRQIVDQDLTGLLEHVKLGYLLGVSYEWDETLDTYVLLYADPEQPTVVELFAPLNLGDVISSMNGSRDLLSVIREQLGHVLLIQFANALGDQDNAAINAWFGDGRTVADLVVEKEDGGYTLDFLSLFNDRYLGELLGYTPIRAGGEDSAITGWMDHDEPVSGLMRGLSRAYLQNLGTDDFRLEDIFEDLYFGDLLNLCPVYDEEGNITAWTDPDGAPADSMYAKLASHGLNEIIGEDGDFQTLLEGMYVGDLLGYHQDGEGEWRNSAEEIVSGANRVIADIDLGRLHDDEDYEITDAFEGHKLGEMLGYHQNGDGEWLSEADEKVTGVNEIIADVDLGRLIGSDEDYEIIDAFDGHKLGEMLGYHQNGDGEWLNEAEEEITGVNAIVADIDLGKLFGDDEDYQVSDAFEGHKLGEMLGYEQNGEGEWMDGETPVSGMDRIIADIDIGKLLGNDEDYQVSDAFEGHKLGEMLGYEQDGEGEWMDGETPVSGMDRIIADIDIGKLLGDDEEYEVADAFEGHKLGEMLGYEQNGEGQWLKDGVPVTGVSAQFADYDLRALVKGEIELSEEVDGMTFADVMGYTLNDEDGKWYDSEDREVSGVLAVLAPRTIGSLDEEENGLNDIQIGKILGWEYDEENDKWLNEDGDPATGIMASFASLTIDEMSDDARVKETVNKLSIGDVMGYTLNDEDGKWHDSGDREVTGILSVLAPRTIGSLDAEENGLNDIRIGEILSWEYDEENDKWLNEDGNPATGIMASFASLTIDEMSDDACVKATVNELTIGDVMGYTKNDEDGKWYSGETPVTGILSVLAPRTIGSIDAEENGLKDIRIGEILGWEYDGESGKWLNEDGEPTTGIMAIFANLTIDEMSDDACVKATVNDLTIGDVMGYTKNDEDGKWYNGENPVTGILSVLAPRTIGSLDSEEEGLDNIRIGETLGWKYNEESGKWETESGDPATGIMATFANMTIEDISNDDRVKETVGDLAIGDVMGYTKNEEEDLWYDGEMPVTGIMKILSPKKIRHLDDNSIGVNSILIGEMMGWERKDDGWYIGDEKQTGIMTSFADLSVQEFSDKNAVSAAVDTIVIGEAMGYTKNEEDGKWYDGEEPISGILASIADTQIAQLGDQIKNLTLADVFAEEDLNTGFLKLLPPDTKITEMHTAATTAFSETSIGDMMDAGLLDLSEDEEALDVIFAPDDWRDYTIQEFIDGLIGKISELMP